MNETDQQINEKMLTESQLGNSIAVSKAKKTIRKYWFVVSGIILIVLMALLWHWYAHFSAPQSHAISPYELSQLTARSTSTPLTRKEAIQLAGTSTIDTSPPTQNELQNLTAAP